MFRDVLRNSNDDAKRREALMYLVHFMGDIHQPLHCAERQCDQGGNLEHVTVTLHSGERPDRRLHAAWDIDFVDKLMEDAKITDPEAYATLLANSVQPKQADAWKGASVDEIAWEGWELAKKHAYDAIPDLDYCDPDVKAQAPVATYLGSGYGRHQAGDGAVPGCVQGGHGFTGHGKPLASRVDRRDAGAVLVVEAAFRSHHFRSPSCAWRGAAPGSFSDPACGDRL